MKKFIILGMGVFIVSLMIYAPAGMIVKTLPVGISAQQFDGNIWQGSAVSLSVNGVSLGLVSWRIKPACLLAFTLCVQITQRDQSISASMLLKVGDTVELHELKAEGSIGILGPLLNQYGVTPSGNFSVDMLKIVVHNGQLKNMEGKLHLSSLALHGLLRVFIGDADAVFKPEGNHTQITASNQKGHIDMRASAVLKADLSYQLDMTISSNTLSSEAVINGMQYIGRPLPDGSRQVQQSGSLASSLISRH